MKLSYPNMIRILAYLKSTDAFSVNTAEEIAEHLDKLIRRGQFDAAETADGRLIYACAWWRMTDRILEEVKKFNRPKRIDRGRNVVGVFFINDMLGVASMLAVFRKILKSQKAKTLSIYTTRKKWVSVNLSEHRGKKMPVDTEPRALKILRRAA